MVKKTLILIVTLMLISSCSKEYESRTGKASLDVCEENTTLVEGKGVKITVSDFRYVEKLLNPKAKEFFSKHPEDLLNRIVNRRLVIRFVEDEGLDEKYHIKEEINRFKKEYLARLFVSEEANKRAGNITEKDIERRFRELFPNKKVSEMTEGDRKFIADELRVKRYDKAVSSIYGEVERKIVFKRDNSFLVAECCGVMVKEKLEKEENLERLKNELKKKLLTEVFYRKAVEANLDKRPDFKRMFEEYYASRAVKVFREVLKSKISLSDGEIKNYYEKNKDRFFMPERARAVVFYFTDKRRAKEAKELLERGKAWEQVARRFGKFPLKPKIYYNDPKDPIGTLIFLSGDNRKKKVLIADLGNNRFVVVKVLELKKAGVLPYPQVKGYVRQVLLNKKLREREKEMLNLLRKKYNIRYLNEKCIL